MSGSLKLQRKSSFVYGLRKFGVFVDGQKIGAIGNGKTEVFELPPGRHNVFIKVSWCKSKQIDLDVADGDVKELECGTPLGLWYVGVIFACVMLMNFTEGIVKFIVCLLVMVLGIVGTVMTFQPNKYIYLSEGRSLTKVD